MNMYGVEDCPKCGSGYRWPTQPTHSAHPNSIICDDCGLVEPLPEGVVSRDLTKEIIDIEPPF